jgi:hypothetical protein
MASQHSTNQLITTFVANYNNYNGNNYNGNTKENPVKEWGKIYNFIPESMEKNQEMIVSKHTFILEHFKDLLNEQFIRLASLGPATAKYWMEVFKLSLPVGDYWDVETNCSADTFIKAHLKPSGWINHKNYYPAPGSPAMWNMN